MQVLLNLLLNLWNSFPNSWMRRVSDFKTFCDTVLVSEPRHGTAAWTWVQCWLFQNLLYELPRRWCHGLGFGYRNAEILRFPLGLDEIKSFHMLWSEANILRNAIFKLIPEAMCIFAEVSSWIWYMWLKYLQSTEPFFVRSHDCLIPALGEVQWLSQSLWETRVV